MCKRRKYDYEFRVQCVVRGNGSVKRIAREKGIEHSNLRLWLMFYQAYGPPGLKPRAKRHYKQSFKLCVLKAIVKDGLCLREVCVRFNIPGESVIINWRKAYESQGESGLIAKPKGRSSQMKPPIKCKANKSVKPLTREEELLLVNEYLRAENELLKKLQALSQARKRQKP